MSSDSEASSAAWNAAGQAASAGIAAIGQSVATKKQFKRSKELMALQMQNQEQMNETAYARQMQMWEDTNYDAQMKQMKKAGLSAGLMYGGSGGGGTTVGSNSAGGASGGAAPQVGMDIGSIVAASKAMAELGMMKAQTKKTKEEAEAQEIENRKQNSGYGYEADVYENSNRASKALSEGQIMFEGKKQPDNLFEKMKLEEQEAMMQEFIGKRIDNEAKRAGINLTKEQTEAIWHEIRQKWASVGINGIGELVKKIIMKK